MREIWIYTIDRVINRSFSRWNLWIYYFRLRLRLSKMRLHLFNSAVIVNSKMDYSHLELEIFFELSGIRILLLSNSKVCTNNNYCCCRELRFPSNLTSTRCTRLFILCAWKKFLLVVNRNRFPHANAGNCKLYNAVSKRQSRPFC